MHRIKEFLQKKKGLGPVAALVLLAAVLGLAIALRAGKLENMFDPDSFVTQEEQKEEFDPREYGLEEDGRKQREEDTTREMRRLPGRMTDRTRSRRDRKIFCRRRNHSRRKMITETHHRREKTNRKGKSRETRITRYSVPAMTMKIPAVRKSSRAVTTGKNRMTGRKETGRSQVLPFPITEIRRRSFL